MTNILKIQEKIKNFKIMLPSLQNLGLEIKRAFCLFRV